MLYRYFFSFFCSRTYAVVEEKEERRKKVKERRKAFLIYAD